MYIPQIPLSIMENTRFTGFVNTIISYYCNNMVDEERPMNTITYTSGGPSHANVINSSSRTLSGISGSQDTDSDTEALSDSSLEEEEEEGEEPWGQFVYTDVDPTNANQLPTRLPRLHRQNAYSRAVYPSTPVNDVWSSDEEE